MPAQITQKNVRLLIPGKAAGVAVLMSEKYNEDYVWGDRTLQEDAKKQKEK